MSCIKGTKILRQDYKQKRSTVLSCHLPLVQTVKFGVTGTQSTVTSEVKKSIHVEQLMFGSNSIKNIIMVQGNYLKSSDH